MCELIVISLAAKLITCGQLSFPIAIGKTATPTPTGTYDIETMHIDPRPSLFGTRAICFNQFYCIHGTNQPGLIGQAVSLGCVRMQNSDIEQLFEATSFTTRISIQ